MPSPSAGSAIPASPRRRKAAIPSFSTFVGYSTAPSSGRRRSTAPSCFPCGAVISSSPSDRTFRSAISIIRPRPSGSTSRRASRFNRFRRKPLCQWSMKRKQGGAPSRSGAARAAQRYDSPSAREDSGYRALSKGAFQYGSLRSPSADSGRLDGASRRSWAWPARRSARRFYRRPQDVMDGRRVRHPGRIAIALDHYAPAPNPKTSALHDRLRAFAAAQGVALWEVGDGIGHQLMVESGRAVPGSLVVGADSHAVTYGALNAFATGIGSSDLAAIMLCGRLWLRVPESIRVTLEGELPVGIYPKDVALALAKRLGADGATYRAMEFHGSGLARLDLEDRQVLSNLCVEMGAKCGVFPADEKTLSYLDGRARGPFACVAPDADASYAGEVDVDLRRLTPLLALPHQVDRKSTRLNSSH